MHFGFSVLITLLAACAVLGIGVSGNRQPVYVAAVLGAIGAIGLPMRGEDGTYSVLCWVLLLASGVAVLIARHKLAPVLAGAQAQAPEIEAGAKRRPVDECDAARKLVEVTKRETPLRRDPDVPEQNIGTAKITDLGLSRKQNHEARETRDAGGAEPGIVRRVLDDAVQSGEEPANAKRRRAVREKRKRRRAGRGLV
jgi:hypothetical protein